MTRRRGSRSRPRSAATAARRGRPAPGSRTASTGPASTRTAAPAARRATTGSARPAPGRSPKAASRKTEDAITIYRRITAYSRTMRGSLAVSLALLAVSLGVRDLGGTPPPLLAELGLGFMVAFITIAGVKHYKALYRMRRHHPGAWIASPGFIVGMLGAPFGAGDPDATPADRRLLRATAVLALALLILAVAGGITKR